MTRKTEILFYYESRANPNGDPGFDNQPRQMPDGTILVTDVRVKRTMRDYAKQSMGMTLFVDLAGDGLPVPARRRAQEIVDGARDGSKDWIKVLLKNTFDVPLFGALIPFPGGKDEDSNPMTGEKGFQKLTGPMQFSIGRSVNRVNIIHPQITSRFVGDEAKGRQTTMGGFYAVDYALIKTSASINPVNLGEYAKDGAIYKNFENSRAMVPECLWEGTNELVARSKYPQRSILYVEVNYRGKIYNDLPHLVSENKDLRDAKDLGTSPFAFDGLKQALEARKDHIESVKIRHMPQIKGDIDGFAESVNGIHVDRI